MTILTETTPALPRRGVPNADPRLDAIRDKVDRGERLTLDDGELLYSTPDIWSVCELADTVRRRLNGDLAYYNINRHLNYSNICALSCKFCEFYRKKGDDGAYTRDMDYVREEARKAVENGATEIHSVGGLHPYMPFSYYTDLVSTIRDTAREMGSELHVKAFTAVEVVHLAKIAKVYKQDDRIGGIRYVLEKLKEAGLGSLPGGGAEVFDDRVHDEAYKGKIRSDVWLDVHRVAHELGLNTNATILYGHIEQRAERLVHMDMLRRAQDEALTRLNYTADPTGAITLTRPGTLLPEQVAFAPRPGASSPSAHSSLPAGSGYFQTIIPLPFFPDGSELEHLPGPAGLENLRTLAVSRLMLDNFPHVKSFWIMQTLPMAQLMLQCGADDIDGTVVWYDITKVGGRARTRRSTSGPCRRRSARRGSSPSSATRSTGASSATGTVGRSPAGDAMTPPPASPQATPSRVALPHWAALALVAIVGEVALLFRLSSAPADADAIPGLTELRWIFLIMVVPAAWLAASVLLGRRLSGKTVGSTVPLLVWAATSPVWMYLAVAAAAVTTAGGLTSGHATGVMLTPVLASLALGPATLTSVFVAVHTRSRAAAVACIVAVLPAIGAFLLLDSVTAAPMIWTLAVTFFIIRAGASHAAPPARPSPRRRAPSMAKKHPKLRHPNLPGPACPACGYTGPSYVGSPCPGCGEFSG